ncbi:MAG: hypothetical protein KDD61_07545 [Bdellovibrionales bacterium]|nr:hypothetical protein [Bdellovibrionales bacterium]
MTTNKRFKVSFVLMLGLAVTVTWQGCLNVDGLSTWTPTRSPIENDPAKMSGNGNGAGYGGMIPAGQYYNLSDSDDCLLLNPADTKTSFIDSFLDVRSNGAIVFYDSCNAENGVEVDAQDLDYSALAAGVIFFNDQFFEKYDDPPHLGQHNLIVDMSSINQFSNQVANSKGDTLHSINLIFRTPIDTPSELWLEIRYIVYTTNPNGFKIIENGRIEAVLLDKTVKETKSIYTSRALPSLQMNLSSGGEKASSQIFQEGQISVDIQGIHIEANVMHLQLD